MTTPLRPPRLSGVLANPKDTSVDSAWVSGALDSLAALAGGRPRRETQAPGYQPQSPRGGSALRGQYNPHPLMNSMWLNPEDESGAPAPYAAVRKAMVHEMGHARRRNYPGIDGVFAAPKAGAERTETEPSDTQDPEELYARAFANAYLLLSESEKAANEGRDWRTVQDSLLADAERRAPGTTGLVSTLLKHPVYANHVANREPLLAERRGEPVDATRVRRP